MNEGPLNTPSPPARFRDATVSGFALTFAFLLVGGVLGFANVRRLASNNRWVAHTHEVIGQAEILMSTVKDAETGQRGYLLTEEESYLEPYENGLRRVQDEQSKLQKLTFDNPRQLARLADLEKKIALRLKIMQETVNLMRQGQRQEAVGMVRSNAGKVVMDQIRREVAEFQRTERELLKVRAEDADASIRTTILSVFLTTASGLVLVGFVFYLTQRNLQQRSAAAATIAEQAERLRTTFASIGDAVITTDKEGRVTGLNAVAESLTGWSKAEATGVPLTQVFNIVNETTRLPVENPASKALAHGIIVGLANHTILIAKDGTERAIDDSASPIRCRDGELVGCVLVFRDVSEARNAERVLRNSEATKSAMLNTALDSIITCDQEGKMIEFNPAAEKTFGYRREDVIGNEMSDIIVPPSLRERHRQGMARYLRTSESRILGKRLVMTGLRADGSEFPVELAITRIPTDGEPIFTAFLRDITERKVMEDELRRVAANLSDADRRKTEFLAILAHELRNPLAPIRNAVQVMRLTAGDGQATSSASEMLERQVGQLVRLVDDLLDVSRISRGKIELKKSRIELASIVNHAVEAARPLCERMRHALTVELPRRPIYLDGDPTRLAQVIGNLLTNATKFTEAGGEIHLAVELDGSEAMIRVQDTGIGIEAEHLPHIFEMFTQIDTSLERTQSGLGIGLTLVKKLVELHDGRVSVHSGGLGQGTEFVVRLPILADAPQLAAIAKEPVAMSARRVLIVDDNQDSATSLAMLLKITGNQTHTAYDGLAAVEKAAEVQPDLILLDIGLPKLNGYEVCRRIREQPGGKNVVIVALTGWGQEEDRQKSKDAGFDGHLVKPVDLVALAKMLGDLKGPT